MNKGDFLLIEDSCGKQNVLANEIEDERRQLNIPTEKSEFLSKEDWKSPLKCPKCEAKYNNKGLFLEHLQFYSGKPKSCEDCQKVYQNSTSFKFHKQLKMCLKSNKVYKCKLCNKTLHGESQYNIHLSAHQRNQCKTCGDHFAKQKHLEAHIVNVHNGTIAKDLFRCHICERKFAQRRSLVYHCQLAHPGSDVLCVVCLEMFRNHADLEAHLVCHKLHKFTCDKCQQTFSRKQQYEIHLKGHERYKCETCSEGFSAKKLAESHAKLGHKVNGLEPQLQCAQCGEMFLSRTQLNTHMLQHTGGKTLSCEKCKITFKRESNYKNHLESNEHLHGEEPKTLLACKDCGKTFTNKNNLRIHISRMHKANKEHSCPHCEYKTTVLNNLKRHVALHTEKPQFVCDKCGGQFQTKTTLEAHLLRLHNDSKEFSCDKCGKMFTLSSDLNRHLTTKHSEVALYSCHCGNSYRCLYSLRRHQLLSHGKVEDKQKRLKKLYPSEPSALPNSCQKKGKKVKNKSDTVVTSVDDLQLLNSEMPDVSSVMNETNTVVVMDGHPEEMLQVSYNMNFTEDKSQVVYTQNINMSGLQVVDSMIQLGSETSKQNTNVLINVRNLFGRDYILPSSIDSSLNSSLAESVQNISSTNSQKQEVISSLQEYIIPNELNFLNVEPI